MLLSDYVARVWHPHLCKNGILNSFRNFLGANLRNLRIIIQKYSYWSDSLDHRNQTICHFLHITFSLARFSTGLIFFIEGKGKGGLPLRKRHRFPLLGWNRSDAVGSGGSDREKGYGHSFIIATDKDVSADVQRYENERETE